MRVSQKASHTEVERVSEEDVMHGERKGADTLARDFSVTSERQVSRINYSI